VCSLFAPKVLRYVVGQEPKLFRWGPIGGLKKSSRYPLVTQSNPNPYHAETSHLDIVYRTPTTIIYDEKDALFADFVFQFLLSTSEVVVLELNGAMVTTDELLSGNLIIVLSQYSRKRLMKLWSDMDRIRTKKALIVSLGGQTKIPGQVKGSYQNVIYDPSDLQDVINVLKEFIANETVKRDEPIVSRRNVKAIWQGSHFQFPMIWGTIGVFLLPIFLSASTDEWVKTSHEFFIFLGYVTLLSFVTWQSVKRNITMKLGAISQLLLIIMSVLFTVHLLGFEPLFPSIVQSIQESAPGSYQGFYFLAISLIGIFQLVHHLPSWIQTGLGSREKSAEIDLDDPIYAKLILDVNKPFEYVLFAALSFLTIVCFILVFIL
jgi:hypothetical protein